jgi:RHS repeat-associated protein
LIACTYNGHTTSTIYGSDGLRRQSTIDGTTTDYLLDGDTVVQDGHAINGTFTSTATYFNGMYRRDDVAATVRWYIMDGLGSVVGEVDPSGNLPCNRGFDVYGATRAQAGIPTSKHGFVGKLGHETEDASGLEYMRARWYDAAVGRFLREDPGRHGGNWFEYTDDNPVTQCDQDGKRPMQYPSAIPEGALGLWWRVYGPFFINYLELQAQNFLIQGVKSSTAIAVKFAQGVMTGAAAEAVLGPAGEAVGVPESVAAGEGAIADAEEVVAAVEIKGEEDELATRGMFGDGAGDEVDG